jgi:hypothetical protein
MKLIKKYQVAVEEKTDDTEAKARILMVAVTEVSCTKE